MIKVTDRYTHRLTPYLETLLASKPADHPLAKQFLPDERELQTLPDELTDPIGDEAHSPVKGIVHRYPDRVLLKVHHACLTYCRFCFRREMIGHHGEALHASELDAALDYIREHTEIWEVILTGGDPLALSARRLTDIVQRLRAIAHLAVIRIHTRVPIVAPDAIDDPLIETLTPSPSAGRAGEGPQPLYIALHVNHPDELTPEATAALERLRQTGAILLSQTVLLRDVNDSPDTLAALFRTLVRHHIKPYYLHHPDLAPGTAHFRVSIEAGQNILRTLRGKLSGLCLPTYVLDLPGGHGKIPIGPTYETTPTPDGQRQLLDLHGTPHPYPEG